MEMIHDEISNQIVESARQIIRKKGHSHITVRDVLKDINVTNRVFYNRFHNIDEVLEILYCESVKKVRESLSTEWQDGTDFWEHVYKITEKILVLSYESRQHISQYIFETDSASNSNYSWWSQEIIKLIQTGKSHGYIKMDLDENAVSYSIWCFIRGFNTDAMARRLPREDAIKQFRCGFGCFLDGMKS